uniref:Uncharacterized protein n=1 Tax=Aureoumbra lagunensis TaxID=44058 RepID=A0A7S3NI40_9STRA
MMVRRLWLIVIFILLVMISLLFHYSRKESHASIFANKQMQNLPSIVKVELLCEQRLAVWEVDGQARCTADETVSLHDRAWERIAIDGAAGWFALRRAAKYLAYGDDAVFVSLARPKDSRGVAKDGRLHWRFLRHQNRGQWRSLENRYTGTVLQVIDNPNRPGILQGGSVGSQFKIRILDESQLLAAKAASAAAERKELRQRQQDLAKAHRIFLAAKARGENCIISMALYGRDPKYIIGALKNAELMETYFPGWILRIYADRNTVPQATLRGLAALGADVRLVGTRRNYQIYTPKSAGMFWRFFVADDPKVTRFIVRDSDSRLNARDACAVAEWIHLSTTTLPDLTIHSIRDHPNHDRHLNGGLWGATNASRISGKLRTMASHFPDHESYGADLNFLTTEILPLIEHNILSHDSYTCLKYQPNARPFPTQRPHNFQHVGQVFDEFDQPRMDDIDSFLRGNPVPEPCRGRTHWTYG